MALIDPGLLAGVSGKIGSTVFSHNSGGPYIRLKGLTTNPNTLQQQQVRSILSQLTSLWVGTLTEAQRQGWADYAENVPLLNRIGMPRTVSALNMYIRTNVPLLQAIFARQDVAPTIFSLGDFSAPVGVPLAATQVMAVAFTDTDDWVSEDDAAMLVYISRQQNTSINFFKGPYRFAGSIDGDSTTPPTSPQNVNVPFPITEDNKLFFRFQVVRADGRLSADTLANAPILA